MRSRGMSFVKVLLICTTVAVAIAGSMGAVNYFRPGVVVTEAVTGPVVQAFYATGTIAPVREYPIKTPIEGTLEALEGEAFIDKGSYVKKGQPLAKVIDPELQFQAGRTLAELEERAARADEHTSPVLQEFDAKIAAAREMLEISDRERRRLVNLLENSSASQVDYDRVLDRVKELMGEMEALKAAKAASFLRLKADLKVAEAAHKTALWNLEQQTLKSPIDGVVLDRPASAGTRLAVNDHVMLIADVRPENLVMRAAVDEEDMTRVHRDQPVRMTLYSFPGAAFGGKVARIYDKADPDRRTFEIDVAMPKPDPKLAAGMTGELAFVIAERESATVVPAQALQSGKIYAIRRGKLAALNAEVGLKSIERVELTSGVQPGEVIVVSPVNERDEGKTVRIIETLNPHAAAGLNKPKEKTLFRGGF